MTKDLLSVQNLFALTNILMTLTEGKLVIHYVKEYFYWTVFKISKTLQKVLYLRSILSSTVYCGLRIKVHTFSYATHTLQIRSKTTNIQYHGVKGSV